MCGGRFPILLLLGVLGLAGPLAAGESRAGRRAAGFLPVAGDRPANLAPIASGRAARLPAITSGRAANLAPITSGRAANLAPITSGRAANLAPITSGRAANLAPITSGRAANLAPITSGRAANLAPITSGRAANLAPITSGRAANLAPIPPVDEIVSPEAVPDDFRRSVAMSRFPMVSGDVALRRGEHARAAVAFAEAGRRHPDAAGPRFALGDALVGLGEYTHAARTIRNGLALAPKWADSECGGGVRGLAGQRKSVEEFALGNPENADAWFLLGYLRMTSGNRAERDLAERAFSHAASLDPDDQVVLRYLRRLR